MGVFNDLVHLNVNEHTEKKKAGNSELTYLSWPWAWSEIKSRYPDAHYEIWKDSNGLPYTFDPETGYMVYTSVTIDGITHEMWLPVMDGANNAMKAEPYDYTVKNPNFKYAKWDAARNGYYDKYDKKQEEYITKHVNKANMFDINKTIMRCLVKNLAMFGLGLYIYAGEDLPQGEQQEEPDNEYQATPFTPPEQQNTPATIQTAATLPQQSAPDISTPMGYLQNEINFMAQQYGLSFIQMKARIQVYKEQLEAAQKIPKKAFSIMTLDEMKAFTDAVRANYPPEGAA